VIEGWPISTHRRATKFVKGPLEDRTDVYIYRNWGRGLNS